MREFVEETLRGPGVTVVAGRTPVTRRYTGREFTGDYLRTRNGGEREAARVHVAGAALHFHERIVERDDLAGAIKAGGEMVPAIRAIIVVGEVMLARPRKFDGRALEPLGN